MYGKGVYQYSDGQGVTGYFVNGRMISEKQGMMGRRLYEGRANPMPMQSSFTNAMDNMQTRKDWTDNMRQFPRDEIKQLSNTTSSRIPFNPEKLVRLVRGSEEPRPQNLTPRLNIRR